MELLLGLSLAAGGFMADWFVAQALGGLESTACHYLSREDIDQTFCPVAVYREKERRVFPGYIFVLLRDPRAQAAIVNRTRGVLKLLPRWAENPSKLPDGFVEELRGRLERGDFSEENQDQFIYKFAKGDAVEALTGAMRYQKTTFLRYHKGSGIVLLALLGREVEASVPLHQLRAMI